VAQRDPLILETKPLPAARTGSDSDAPAAEDLGEGPGEDAGKDVGDDAGQPIVIRRLEPGERIEIEVKSEAMLRLGVDLSDARAEVVDGEIEVTLPNGGVLVLYGEAVDQFLAGYEDALEQALSPAAGWTEVKRIFEQLDMPAPPHRTSMLAEIREPGSVAAGALSDNAAHDDDASDQFEPGAIAHQP